ncbi:MAG: AraC family transcriptional regulator [Clostridia bacterium]|nr:AraC family transcriptional regulator [Clostridia bacterium]
MNYINELQKAIDYIEDNLENNINFEIVAKEVGMSAFYFHRIFSSVIGISPTTYIRNRRLTVAAQEISKNNENILDIALKYGFESHEAFSRAFKNFHGVVPKMAKTDGNEFKNFSKANLDIEVNINNILGYRIESKDIIKVSAFFRKFNIENKDEIPKYWKELKESGALEKISNKYKKDLLGICIGTQSDFEYKYGIGIEQTEDIDTNIEMEKIEIPKSKWVVFKCEGQDEKNINELWSRIYKEFFITSSYKQCMDIDFELYDDENTEIWIPISKE